MVTNYQIPVSSSLARRLAEAADGFRNVNQVYFIAGYQPPYPIKDFPDSSSAQDYLDQLFNKGYTENDFAIFGPYKTMDDMEELNLVGVENIESVDLTLHYKDGSHKNVCLPGSIDSIFFNLSSFEKFVFPYYCHLYGAEYAKKLRDNLIAAIKESPTGEQMLMALRKPHAPLTYIKSLYAGEEIPDEFGDIYTL